MDQYSEQYKRGAQAVSISLAPILGAEADHLLVLSDEYMASLYPAESNHLVSSESLRTGDAVFLGAFLSSSPDAADQPAKTDEPLSGSEVGDCIACVAARFFREAGYAEIKRLYVQEAHRGLGLSRKLMSAIELSLRLSWRVSLVRLLRIFHRMVKQLRYSGSASLPFLNMSDNYF